MNSLELKGGLFEMIVPIESKEILERLYKVVAETIQETRAEEYELTPEQEAKLAKDIEASYDPKNLISHEEVMKKMERWLSK